MEVPLVLKSHNLTLWARMRSKNCFPIRPTMLNQNQNQTEILAIIKSVSTGFFGSSIFCTPLQPIFSTYKITKLDYPLTHGLTRMFILKNLGLELN